MFLARETRSAAIFYPMFYVSVMMRFPNGVTKSAAKEGKNVYNFYYAQNAVALINFDALMISEKNL